MPYRLDILDHPRADVVLARLSGYGGLCGRPLVEDFAAECELSGWTTVIIDLADLGGITEKTAAALARFRRHLDDRDGALHLAAPNVAVHWVLTREYGEDPGAAADVGEALTALGIAAAPGPSADTPAAERPLPVPRPAVAAAVGSPVRGLAAKLVEALRSHADPERWLDVLTPTLAKAGLGSRAVLSRRSGDRLSVVDHPDSYFPADGGLAASLCDAGGLLSPQELPVDALTTREKAFLLWSSVELHLPLIHNGRLAGLLSFDTGRGRGLYGLRSGEVLALECLGLVMAERLSGLDCPAEEPAGGVVAGAAKAAPDDLVVATMELCLTS